MNKIYQELLEDAKKVSQNTYSPYSNFPVGSCALYESGKRYCGCNVENSSYGLSLCAERCAMSSAIAQGEKTKLRAIAIYSPKMKKCSPCGACRQWMVEFGDENTKIILEDENNQALVFSMDEILPHSFKFN